MKVGQKRLFSLIQTNKFTKGLFTMFCMLFICVIGFFIGMHVLTDPFLIWICGFFTCFFSFGVLE